MSVQEKEQLIQGQILPEPQGEKGVAKPPDARYTDDKKFAPTKPKPTAKMADSVFTHLFAIPEYTLQLYQALMPDNTVTATDQIEIITIENVLLRQEYNDLGFLVKEILKNPDGCRTLRNKLLVLCEAQSTWSPNITFRLGEYLFETLHQYVLTTEQVPYSSTVMDLPDVECFVICTGNQKSRPEQISLSETYHWKNVELKAKVIYDGNEGDILHQYVAFVQIYKEELRMHGRTKETVLETIRICLEQNILKEYLASRKKEVVDIMMSLFDNETIMDAYTHEIRQEEKQSCAQNLCAMGLPLEQIAQAVKVSVATVQGWLQQT